MVDKNHPAIPTILFPDTIMGLNNDSKEAASKGTASFYYCKMFSKCLTGNTWSTIRDFPDRGL